MNEPWDGNRTVICHGINGELAEAKAGDLTFRVSVYGVVFNEGRLLLVPQWDGYDFPGGKVELGEPILEALPREVKEETGLDVKPFKLLITEDSFFLHPYSKKTFHSVTIYYLCKFIGGELSDEGFVGHEKEYSKLAQWIPIEEAKKLKFYNSIQSAALIEQAMATS